MSQGPVLAGVMGCLSRRSFAVVGRAVHMSRDLMKLNWLLGTQVLCDQVPSTSVSLVTAVDHALRLAAGHGSFWLKAIEPQRGPPWMW